LFLRLTGVGFTRDAQALVIAEHQRVHVFDTSTGAELRHFDTEDFLDSNGFALSPDGRWLLAAGREVPKGKKNTDPSEQRRFVTIWDLATGKAIRRTPLPEQYASRVAFSPDGKYYGVVASDYPRGQRLRIWESKSAKEVRVLDNLPETVRAITFSLDSHRLYTSMDDTTVVIWELAR